MGRDFCTIEEAAAILKRSIRSVHTYVRRGLIQRTVEEGKSVLSLSDVHRLASSLAESKPPPTPTELWDLVSRVQRLEMDLTVLKRMLGVSIDPLRPDPAQCLALYGAAKAAKMSGSWGAGEIRLWAEMLPRVDEVVLREVAKAAQVSDPWEPFFSLCLDQIRFCAGRKDYNQSLEWQELHRLLMAAKERLRSAIIGWERTSPPAPTASPLDGVGRLTKALSRV